MVGTTLGSYTVVRELGRGGMGIVYAGKHALLGREAAIKVMPADADAAAVERFFTEARAASAIKHPGIVEVYDFGKTDDGRAYLVMELCEGESLGARIRRLRVLPIAMAVAIARQLADALAAAHAAGIIHRDLKPDNVFVVADDRVKLLDFGIAKLAGEPGVTQTGAIVGTPFYMSPEQCRGAGALDHRADLYALGCILFEMVCGRVPFTGEGAGDVLGKHLHITPPSPRSLAAVPADLDALVLALLAKDPADRPADARAVIAALDRVDAHKAELAGAATVPSVAAQPARVRMPVVPLGLIGAGVVALAAGWLVPSSRGEAPAVAGPVVDREHVSATITSDPDVVADQHVLVDADGAWAIGNDLRKTTSRIGLVVVLDVDAVWLRSNDTRPGAYEPIASAFERGTLAHAGTDTSRLVVITYDREARVARTAQPLANLGDDALDDESTYLTRGRALSAAVLLAEQELDKLTTPRRALLVIGDGHDDDAAGARTLLGAARTRLRRDHVEVYSVTTELPPPQNPRVIDALDPATLIAPAVADIPARLDDIAKRFASQLEVGFDARELAWDGSAHHLTLRIGDTDVDAGEVVLPRWRPTPWRRLFLSIVGLALVAAGVIRSRGSAARAR